MKPMSINLYSEGTDSYESIQSVRPDYSNAIKEVISRASKYLDNDSTMADLCCGTGSITNAISKEIGGLGRVILVDINQKFIDIAKKSDIKAERKTYYVMDVLEANFISRANLVLSVFAYHHFKDKDKQGFINKIKYLLENGGVLVLAEIYLPDREATINYYNNLLKQIPENLRTKELEDFLKQTANSTDFEFKVSKEFAHKQLEDSGFSLIESKKMWPAEDGDTGTFVEVWRFN